MLLNGIIAANGAIYAGGSEDVNNSLVLSITPGNTSQWSTMSNGYMPNPGTNVTEVAAIGVSSIGIVYAASNTNHINGNVYSINGLNGSWAQLGGGNVPDGGMINSIGIDNSNDNICVATASFDAINNVYNSHVYISLGGYGNWQPAVTNTIPDGGVINSLIVQNGTIYIGAGGYNITSNRNFGDVYSNSGGAGTWQQLGGGSIPDHGTVNSITLDTNNNVLYAATSAGHVYAVSLPAGNWQQVGTNMLPDGSAITSLALSANGLVLAATANGNVYAINPAGTATVWQQVGQGTMPDSWAINSLATVNNIVYTATQGGNVYQSTLNSN
jgi:hypothetical protein